MTDASAATADGDGSGDVALVDWGVYAMARSTLRSQPTNTSGEVEIPSDETLLQQTYEICATTGTMFGFRYRLTGAIPVAGLDVVVRILHPGLRNRQGGMQWRDTIDTRLTAGELHWSGWVFRDPRNLVPGLWRFQVVGHGATLLDQSFSVMTACAAPIS